MNGLMKRLNEKSHYYIHHQIFSPINILLNIMQIISLDLFSIVRALTAWEQCTWEVTADCDKLLEDMRNLTDLARNALIEKCPRPTTPPPVVTG